MSSAKLAVWWIRRDLRLADNPALAQALVRAPVVLPLFILDPAVLNSAAHRHAEKRQAFLFQGLRQLDADLRARGSRLIVRQGQPAQVLSVLLAETGADSIIAAEDFTDYSRRRDRAVASALPLVHTGGQTLHHPALVVKAKGGPYTVFTAFSRVWRSLPMPGPLDLLPAPARLAAPPKLRSVALPDLPRPTHFMPGESCALETLRSFTQPPELHIDRYAAARDRLDQDGTSALSPYLRFGMLSARQAVVAAQQAIAVAPSAEARQGAEAWLTELIWREFYNAILYHFPSVARRAFRPALREVAWQNDQPDFAAWCQGRTGYPVVDAAMRQLAATGWMHNRARMLTASFLVKDLLIDWRWGERWFMRHLVDGDPAANNGGWQWVAGVGTDAAPYFRVFNPVLQGRKFDPRGDFVQAWLPELRGVPEAFIHEPWKMPPAVQRQARCVIGRDYPAPIVDHAFARRRALAAYQRGRASAASLPPA